MNTSSDRHEARTWDEMIADAVVVMESDKVKNHTHDDYDLGPGWYFAGGRHLTTPWGTKLEWVTCWVQLRPEIKEEVEPWVIEGIGSAMPKKWRDGTWHINFGSAADIGSEMVHMTDAPPEKLRQFFRI